MPAQTSLFGNEHSTMMIDRLGGPSFDMMMMDMCERILDDHRIRGFYGMFKNTHVMTDYLNNFFTIVFAQGGLKGGNDFRRAEFQVIDMHGQMFGMGMDETHFALLVHHFEEACRDSWVNEDAMEDATILLGEFRNVFVKHERKKKVLDFMQHGDGRRRRGLKKQSSGRYFGRSQNCGGRSKSLPRRRRRTSC